MSNACHHLARGTCGADSGHQVRTGSVFDVARAGKVVLTSRDRTWDHCFALHNARASILNCGIVRFVWRCRWPCVAQPGGTGTGCRPSGRHAWQITSLTSAFMMMPLQSGEPRCGSMAAAAVGATRGRSDNGLRVRCTLAAGGAAERTRSGLARLPARLGGAAAGAPPLQQTGRPHQVRWQHRRWLEPGYRHPHCQEGLSELVVRKCKSATKRLGSCDRVQHRLVLLAHSSRTTGT